jgi:hypothetical protein
MESTFCTIVNKWQLKFMTINPYRLETKTTEAIIICYVKLCVKHNSVSRNDISTQTVLHSVVTSISRRVVSVIFTSGGLLLTINVVLNRIYNMHRTEVLWIGCECTISAYSSITVILRERDFWKRGESFTICMFTLKQRPGKIFSPLSTRESGMNEKRYRRNTSK